MSQSKWFGLILEGLSLVKWIGTAISGLIRIDRNKNKKIERDEVLLLIQEVVNFELFTLVPNVGESIRQIIKSTPEDREELIIAFAEKFDLENDDLEHAIEDIISSGHNFTNDLTTLVKMIKTND